MKSGLNLIALAGWQRGRWDEAARYLGAALKLAERDGDDRGIAAFSGNLGMNDWSRGDFVAAAARFRRAVDSHRAQRNMAGLAAQLNNLGDALGAQGRVREAIGVLLEGLQLAVAHGLDALRSNLLMNLGVGYLELDDPAAARRYLQQALDTLAGSGERQCEAPALSALGRVAVLEGDFEAARSGSPRQCARRSNATRFRRNSPPRRDTPACSPPKAACSRRRASAASWSTIRTRRRRSGASPDGCSRRWSSPRRRMNGRGRRHAT
jgi:Flp pilus assembly protein TadD